MSHVDFTALRPGTIIHGGGIGILVEPINTYSAKVMSLSPEDIGQVREWGNSCDVVSEPKDDVDAAKLMRAYNVAGLMEEMTDVVVLNTEAVWAEYRLQVKVPTRLTHDPNELHDEAIQRIEAGDFTTLAGPDIRCSVDGHDQEYEIQEIVRP